MGLEQLTAAGIGTGPLSPFDVARPLAAIPEVVAHALARVDGVHSAVAPADWRRDGTAVITVIPTAGRQLARGPRHARPHPRRHAASRRMS